jgi:hypothetical protein
MEHIDDKVADTLAAAIQDQSNPGRAKKAAEVGTRWLDLADLGALTMSAVARQSVRQALEIS